MTLNTPAAKELTAKIEASVFSMTAHILELFNSSSVFQHIKTR